jgi:acyl-coenzyme A thioesterase PaaI-like protein
VSPVTVTKWLNTRLICIDNKYMDCEFEVRPEMANPPGMLHDGIGATMLSDVLRIFSKCQGDEVPAI